MAWLLLGLLSMWLDPRVCFEQQEKYSEKCRAVVFDDEGTGPLPYRASALTPLSEVPMHRAFMPWQLMNRELGQIEVLSRDRILCST